MVVDCCAVLLQAKACMEEAEGLGLELDVWSYATLIKGLCQAERMHDAEAVLLAMKSHGVQPNVVSASFLLGAALRNRISPSLPAVIADQHHFGWDISYNFLCIQYRSLCALLQDMNNKTVAAGHAWSDPECSSIVDTSDLTCRWCTRHSWMGSCALETWRQGSACCRTCKPVA